MKGRFAVLLGVTALVLSVLGSTSLGSAAGNAIQTVRGGKAKAAQQVRRGPRGPRGFRGRPGPAGPAGIARLGAIDGPAAFQCADGGGGCQVAASTATCPAGSYVVGGGFDGSTPGEGIVYAKRVSPTSYGVIAVNFWPTDGTITAQAICASGSGIQATGLFGSPAQFAAKLSEVRAQLAR
jgi:hypothetical protein